MAALSEIAEQSPQTKVFDLNGPTINKLLTALNECTEWGQVFILDAIANYSPKVVIDVFLLDLAKLLLVFAFLIRTTKKHKAFANELLHD